MGVVPVDWSVNCTINGDVVPCLTLDVNCAFGGSEAADTTPGSIRASRTSPIIRLIVLDFAKIFMTQSVVATVYKLANPCQSGLATFR